MFFPLIFAILKFSPLFFIHICTFHNIVYNGGVKIVHSLVSHYLFFIPHMQIFSQANCNHRINIAFYAHAQQCNIICLFLLEYRSYIHSYDYYKSSITSLQRWLGALYVADNVHIFALWPFSMKMPLKQRKVWRSDGTICNTKVSYVLNTGMHML